jgi:hypothetical protein
LEVSISCRYVLDEIKYKTIVLPVVLYGCATWSPTLEEEQKLMVFQNRVLKRVFGLKRDEIIGT